MVKMVAVVEKQCPSMTGFIFILRKMRPTIYIEYCPKCGWMLRATWMAQELLTTFTDDLFGVLLQPSAVSGRFTVSVNGNTVFDRKIMGHFPEIKEIKQAVRDLVNPTKSLGHSDKKT